MNNKNGIAAGTKRRKMGAMTIAPRITMTQVRKVRKMVSPQLGEPDDSFVSERFHKLGICSAEHLCPANVSIGVFGSMAPRAASIWSLRLLTGPCCCPFASM